MSENGGVRNVEFCECLLDQFGLGLWGPDHIARAIAVTEPGSVENDDPEMSCRKINQTAGIKVFNHTAVAVQQNQGFARAPLNVVETNATYIEEAAGRWIVTLRLLCKMTID